MSQPPQSTLDSQDLDPRDWDAFRKLAHEALDDALNYVAGVRERAVWQLVPEQVRERLKEPLPLIATPIEQVYEEFRQSILPYATGNVHPRFFGWVHGAGQPGNIIAEMMAAAMNSNCGGRDHGAIYVEREVIEWSKQMFGFPAGASGLLVSGTSMANLVALGTARNAAAEGIRAAGIAGAGKLVAYASSEAHASLTKAMEILGLGSESLRKIATHGDFTIDVGQLRRAIEHDRAAGARPFCVVGCAGTVNTGALDNLNELAELCAEEKIWFHVDGAFGGLCVLNEKLRARVAGVERADSVAFDFHKWANVQYDAGCVLVRDAKLQQAAYSTRPSYLQHLQRGLSGGDVWPCDLGPELSRSFRALKVWFTLKEHGAPRLGEIIERNCEQALYLAERVTAAPGLELLTPCTLNIVCFRVRAAGLDEAALDRLNEDIVADVQESGAAAPSTCRVRGRLAIRVNITNHRTRIGDVDILLEAVSKAALARGVCAARPNEAAR